MTFEDAEESKSNLHRATDARGASAVVHAARSTDAQTETRWSLGEYYSALLHQLRARFPDLRSQPLAIGLLGTHSGCGVSMTAAGLARAAAENGRCEVLLIDANIRRPNVAKRFRLGAKPGLTDLLMEKASVDECLHPSSIARLKVMSAGRARRLQLPPEGFAECLKELRHTFDFIIVDLPLLEEPDACGPVAAMLDGVLLVMEPGKTQREQGQSYRRRLTENGARLLGVVVNNA